ncbi:hypothetical protein G2W53_039536 [Senna tora]|uniref:Uncharacterized protein n=1 Tax=Senna tora TaxID=362788 RepID=A0A834SR02_9FABA|nr:hypothetical protein G2W53_039536 [Senna tora]
MESQSTGMHIKWHPPREHWAKLNVDGSHWTHAESTSCGGVVKGSYRQMYPGLYKKHGRKKFARRTPINVDSSSEHSEAFNRDTSIPMKKATALKEDEDLSSYSHIFESLPSTHGSPIKGDRLIKAKLCTLESSANMIDGDIQELKKDFEHFKKTTKKHHKKIMSMLSKIYKSLN